MSTYSIILSVYLYTVIPYTYVLYVQSQCYCTVRVQYGGY